MARFEGEDLLAVIPAAGRYRAMAQRLRQEHSLAAECVHAAELGLREAEDLGDREVIERRQLLLGRARRYADGLALADHFVDEASRPGPMKAS
jgi:hypothetical protein